MTGPDEYTTVVNDNFYTNVMARFNLRYAARTVQFLARGTPRRSPRSCRSTGLTPTRSTSGTAAADAMYLPYDEELGIHPQDSEFLDLERWDFENTGRR